MVYAPYAPSSSSATTTVTTSNGANYRNQGDNAADNDSYYDWPSGAHSSGTEGVIVAGRILKKKKKRPLNCRKPFPCSQEPAEY